MTRHEKITAGAPITDGQAHPAAGIDPAFDVAQIATRGHVLTARLEWLSRRLMVPMVGAAVVVFASVSGLLGSGGMMDARYSLSGGFIDPIRGALTYNPNDYFDIGGGLRGGPEFAWLAAYAPTPESLSKAELDDLVIAIANDLGQFGAKPSEWTAVAEVKTPLTVTRPEKVFAEHAAAVETGVVALPDDAYSYPSLVAYVEGQWSLTVFNGRRCLSAVGPVVEQCADGTTKNGLSADARSILETYKPR